MVARTFDDLVAEAAAAPVDRWDFTWLEGRAIEERPSWRYFDRVAERVGDVDRMLDVETGVGNLLADLPALPQRTAATDAYVPSIAAAAPRLRPRGVLLARTDAARLPFPDASFELVTSRHPIETQWREIARVLAPGGEYLSQQVGPRSVGELSAWFLGVAGDASHRDPSLARRAAEAAGLVVEDLRSERPRTAFFDVGAVVYFLRLVVWIVPGFTVERHRERLRDLHAAIERTGSFETTASRFLIRAVKPA